MAVNKRKVEVFSAGCGLCDETIALVQRLACESCEVTVHDMKKSEVAKQAKGYGVQSVPRSWSTASWPNAAQIAAPKNTRCVLPESACSSKREIYFPYLALLFY